MIRTDEVDLFELFQSIIVASATAPKVDPTGDSTSHFSPAPDALNSDATRLSELGGGPGLIAAVAARLDADGNAHLATAMRRCAAALDDPALVEVRAGAERRLLGYVYPVV